MKKILLSVGIVLLASLGVYTVATHKYTSEPTKTATVTSVKATTPTVSELLELVNAERAKVGVKPLVLDERLNQSAQRKADDMVINRYFGHVDKDGVHGYEYARQADPTCRATSENITDNTDDSINTAKQAVYSWVNSKKHYEAMTNSEYTTTGFGVADTKIVEHFCKH